MHRTMPVENNWKKMPLVAKTAPCLIGHLMFMTDKQRGTRAENFLHQKQTNPIQAWNYVSFSTHLAKLFCLTYI